MKQGAAVYAPLVLLVLFLCACAPGAGLVQSPTFRFVPEGSGLQKLEPPGAGRGQAVFRINLEVSNPNPLGLELAGLDFDLALNGHRVASSSFAGGVSLAAGGTSRLSLDVAVPLGGALQFAEDLVKLLAGEPTTYTLTGTVSVDVFGMRQQLPKAVLASGTLTQPLQLVVPQVRFLPQASGLRDLSLNQAVVEVAVELTNPGPLGYVFRAPALSLRLAGTDVARAGLVSVPVAPFGTQTVALRFVFSPASAGAALYAQLAALSVGSNVSLGVSGAFSLEVPGITSRSVPATQLVSAVLR